MRRILVLSVCLAAMLALAGEALACSCAIGDPRDRLEAADGAFVGTLVERVVDGETAIHTFQVENSVKGALGSTVVVRSHRDGATCGLEIGIGQRIGLFLTRDGADWSAILCDQVAPDELIEATQPLPAPTGSGPLALLVGGSFGDVRTVALDSQGRVLAYGPGDGDVVSLSVCPGAERAVELVSDVFFGGGYTVEIRDLRTMAVVGTLGTTREFSTSYPETVRCLDRDGSEAALFAREFGDTADPDRIRILTPGGSTTIWRGSAQAASFTAKKAFVCKGNRGRNLVAVSLGNGDERALARIPAFTGPLAPSPGGRYLAGVAFGSETDRDAVRSYAVMVDLRAPRSVRTAPLGGPYVFGEMLWRSPSRVVFVPERGEFDRIRTYDASLRLLARGELFVGTDAALLDDRLIALAGPFLVEAAPPTGRLSELSELPGQVTHAIEAVRNGHPIEPAPTGAGSRPH